MKYYIRYKSGSDCTIWETNEEFTMERKIYDSSSGKRLDH